MFQCTRAAAALSLAMIWTAGVAMLGCGGDDNAKPNALDGSTDGSSGGQNDGGANDGGVNDGGDAGACVAISRRMSETRAAAIACDPSAAAPPQCGQTVSDLCNCHIPVTDATSDASKAFTASVAAYRDNHCPRLFCHECLNRPTPQCVPNDGGAIGTCR